MKSTYIDPTRRLDMKIAGLRAKGKDDSKVHLVRRQNATGCGARRTNTGICHYQLGEFPTPQFPGIRQCTRLFMSFEVLGQCTECATAASTLTAQTAEVIKTWKKREIVRTSIQEELREECNRVIHLRTKYVQGRSSHAICPSMLRRYGLGDVEEGKISLVSAACFVVGKMTKK